MKKQMDLIRPTAAKNNFICHCVRLENAPTRKGNTCLPLKVYNITTTSLLASATKRERCI